MSGEDFQEALHNYAGFGFEYKVPAMLVDVRQFRYTMTPALGVWRDKEISPRYAKFNLKKFAYIVAAGVLENMKDVSGESIKRSFDEQYFDEEKKAIQWLLS